MRIGINAAIVDSRPTGLGVYSMEVAKRITELNSDTLIYTSTPSSFGDAEPYTRCIPSSTQPSRGAAGHFSRLAWLQTLPFTLHRDRVDVLFSTVPEAPLVSKTPMVVTVHDLLPLLYPAEYPRQQYYFSHYVPHVLRRARFVLADSEYTKQCVVTRYRISADKVRVVYLGFDSAHYRRQLDAGRLQAKYQLEDDGYLLYIGNFLPHKNLLRLVEAYALSGTARRLVLVGYPDPRYVGEVRQRIDTLGISDRVRILGYVPHSDLPLLYSHASALCLVSLCEGFGFPIVEAMATGTPVLTANASSTAEIAKGAAVLVDPLDPEDIARGLVEIQEPGVRTRLIKAGTERVGHYNWDRAARTTLEVIRTAAGG